MNNTDFKDYYQVLGIKHTATVKEIKSAYRKLAMQFHPDVLELDNSIAFQEIGEAYEVLSNPAKKEGYDYLYQGYVLGLAPLYEYVVDDAPPDTNTYEHKYTTRSKVMWFFVILLFIVLGLRLIQLRF